MSLFSPGFYEIDRFEVINYHSAIGNNRGRAFVAYNCEVELAVQDDGKTLKVFVYEREK